jgi:hypothetical protein
MRCTLETDKPLAFAMPRELQCVASLGTLSKVVTITGALLRADLERRHSLTDLLALAAAALLADEKTLFALGRSDVGTPSAVLAIVAGPP